MRSCTIRENLRRSIGGELYNRENRLGCERVNIGKSEQYQVHTLWKRLVLLTRDNECFNILNYSIQNDMRECVFNPGAAVCLR